MNRIKYILPIIIGVLMFSGFLIGCSSDSGNEKKEWVLNEESVMDYDSLTSNYEFLGEWKYHFNSGDIDITTYMEFYNSGKENTCYHVWKENTMTIKEYKRDGNKYWGVSKDEYYVIDENGELICYDEKGLIMDDLETFGVYITKIR